jgi:exosortase E/protease (VPEID-CTERM system)
LIPRLAAIIAVLVAETLLLAYLRQGVPLESLVGFSAVVDNLQHWLFRFMIAYAASFALLVYLQGRGTLDAISATSLEAPIRIPWLVVHALLLIPFAAAAALYGHLLAASFPALVIGWRAFAAAGAVALFAAMAPLGVWTRAVRQTAPLPWVALLPAAAAMLAIRGSQLLWGPAAQITFRLVQILVRPLCPSLHSDFATLTVATDRFEVRISELCSGLEGVGLMLAFCTAWLWYFRREYYFPRALIIVPLAALLVFFLNALRIAALVLIGDAGYAQIAMFGFHSQAGWIAFNLAAFGVAILASRSPWLNRTARQPRASTNDGTAAYLMPLLAILAAGMLAHALSAGFDLLYPLRLVCAAIVLWAYRHRYRELDWRASWRGIATGVLIFGVWVEFAHFMTKSAAIPAALTQLPGPLSAAWVACRASAAIITVPIAEELAYRGYLLRRLAKADFESVAFREVRWPALVISSIVFGITHGNLWLPGLAAGLAYGALAMKSGRIGESVVAHATTNALLGVYVLIFNQWQLW